MHFIIYPTIYILYRSDNISSYCPALILNVVHHILLCIILDTREFWWTGSLFTFFVYQKCFCVEVSCLGSDFPLSEMISQPNWRKTDPGNQFFTLPQITFVFVFFFVLSKQFSGQSKYFHCVTQTKQKTLWKFSWSCRLFAPCDISGSARLTIVWSFCSNWGSQGWTGWAAVFCSPLILKPRALQWNVIFQGHARRRWLLEVIMSVQEKITYTHSSFHWELQGNKKKQFETFLP